MTTYRVDHQADNGWPIIVRINDNGTETSQVPTADGSGPLRAEFDVWNATQQPPLVVAIAVPVVQPTPFGDYARAFVVNAPLWVKIHKALDDARFPFVVAVNTPSTILANLQSQVTAVVTVINSAPAGVIAEFQKERTLQGSSSALSPAGIAAMTATECRILINVSRQAADQGLSIALAASLALD